MSLHRFGLVRRPFRPTPALDLYVPIDASEQAIAALHAAFEQGEGLTLLDGEAGTGKTLTALRLLESLGTDATPIYVAAARFQRPAELHQAILFDLGQPYVGLGEQESRLAITQQLLALKPRGVLVLDEAHHLSNELLDEVRLLDNLEHGGTKAMLIVLVAWPELRDRLSKSNLLPLAQRISCRCRLLPMSKSETESFLRQQVNRVGGNVEKLFTDEALDLLAAHAGGVPRVVNQIAAGAMQLAETTELNVVDAEVAFEALSQAGIVITESEQTARSPYSSGAARSTPGESRERGEEREPPVAGVPKQKARTRRAA